MSFWTYDNRLSTSPGKLASFRLLSFTGVPCCAMDDEGLFFRHFLTSSAFLLFLVLAWTSLDCLLTSFPISPNTRSSGMVMRSTMNLQLSDTRRISPQTTTSSGYHSDLSSATSANQSPQSIQDILPDTSDKLSSSSQIQKKTISNDEKSTTNKSFSRLSSFLRRQYDRARSKLSSVTHHSTHSSSSSSSQQKPSTIPTTVVHTCSKATSTTPLSHLSDSNYAYPKKSQQKTYYQPQYLSSVYKQSSYGEPVSCLFIRICLSKEEFVR